MYKVILKIINIKAIIGNRKTSKCIQSKVNNLRKRWQEHN